MYRLVVLALLHLAFAGAISVSRPWGAILPFLVVLKKSQQSKYSFTATYIAGKVCIHVFYKVLQLKLLGNGTVLHIVEVMITKSPVHSLR